jgi:hypothetical protein
MPRSPVNRLNVTWNGGTVTAMALQMLREHSKPAKSMSMSELSKALGNGTSFELGLVTESNRVQMSSQFEQAGFIVKTDVIS